MYILLTLNVFYSDFKLASIKNYKYFGFVIFNNLIYNKFYKIYNKLNVSNNIFNNLKTKFQNL